MTRLSGCRGRAVPSSALLVAVAIALAGCASRPTARMPATTAHTPTPRPLTTLSDAPEPTPWPAPSPYGQAIADAYKLLGDAETGVTRICDDFMSDECLDALVALRLVIQGARQRIEAAGAPGPHEPPLADVQQALQRIVTGIDDLQAANRNGDSRRANTGSSEMDGAVTHFTDALGDFGESDALDGAAPLVDAVPLPAGTGHGVAAHTPFTLAAQRVYAELAPAMAALSHGCAAIYADACGAAVRQFRSVFPGAVSSLSAVAIPTAAAEAGAFFKSATGEAKQAADDLDKANAGDWTHASIGSALLYDAAWRMRDTLTTLRG